MKSLKRIILKIAYPIMSQIWKFTKPTTLGVRVLVFNEANKVLLLEHSYKNNLYPPGGAVDKFELLEDAAIREVWEETSIQIKKLDIIGVYRRFYEHKNDTLVLFASKLDSDQDIEIDRVEIVAADWYDPKDLPSNTSPSMIKYITDYIANSKKVNFD